MQADLTARHRQAPCPYCGAEPGILCKGSNGGFIVNVHGARKTEAKRIGLVRGRKPFQAPIPTVRPGDVDWSKPCAYCNQVHARESRAAYDCYVAEHQKITSAPPPAFEDWQLVRARLEFVRERVQAGRLPPPRTHDAATGDELVHLGFAAVPPAIVAGAPSARAVELAQAYEAGRARGRAEVYDALERAHDTGIGVQHAGPLGADTAPRPDPAPPISRDPTPCDVSAERAKPARPKIFLRAEESQVSAPRDSENERRGIPGA